MLLKSAQRASCLRLRCKMNHLVNVTFTHIQAREREGEGERGVLLSLDYLDIYIFEKKYSLIYLKYSFNEERCFIY